MSVNSVFSSVEESRPLGGVTGRSRGELEYVRISTYGLSENQPTASHSVGMGENGAEVYPTQSGLERFLWL